MIRTLLTAFILTAISVPAIAQGLDGKGLICHTYEPMISMDPKTLRMFRKRNDYSRGYWFENGKVREHVLGPDGIWSSIYEYEEIGRNTVMLLSDHPMYRIKYLHRETLLITDDRYERSSTFAEHCSLVSNKKEIIDILNSVIERQKRKNKI